MGVRVAFDIGNVLCQFDIMKFVNKLAEIAQITSYQAWFFLDHLQKMQDIGVTSVAHGLEYKFKLNKEELKILVDAWNDTLSPNEMMLNFLDNLKSDGVKIALLSNMGPEHLSYLRSTCSQMFEQTMQHISCEVGARKPQKLFFQSFCLDNDDFNGCSYIDDIEDNLKMGKKYGFKTYNFDLDKVLTLPQGKQKVELNKLKCMIYEKS